MLIVVDIFFGNQNTERDMIASLPTWSMLKLLRLNKFKPKRKDCHGSRTTNFYTSIEFPEQVFPNPRAYFDDMQYLTGDSAFENDSMMVSAFKKAANCTLEEEQEMFSEDDVSDIAMRAPYEEGDELNTSVPLWAPKDTRRSQLLQYFKEHFSLL
jgi:hypothetical protein